MDLARRLWRCAALAVLGACAAAPTAALAQGPLRFTTTPPTTAVAGAPFAYTFEAARLGPRDADDDDDGDDDDDDDDDNGGGGPPAGVIAYAVPEHPPWLAFDGVRTISGTPDASQAGEHAVTITATLGPITAAQRFTITVISPNRPPIALPIAPDPQDAFVGEPYRLDLRPFFSDPDGDALTFAAAGLPAGLAIADGAVAGTPLDAAGSPFGVTVTASDGEQQASASFTLRVTQRNRPPRLARSIAPDPQTAMVGSEYTLATAAFFTDPDGDALTFAATGLPASFAIDPRSGRIAGTATDADAAASPYTVTVSAADAEASASDSFTLQVVRPDRPPRRDGPIGPDPQTAAEGEPYSFDAGRFFSDPDGDPLEFSATGLPPSFAIARATGRIRGTAGNVDVEGTPYRVTVTAANSGGSASGQFTLRIEGRNERPSIPRPVPELTTPEDTPLRVTAALLRATDPDPGDELTVLLSAPPADAPYTISGERVVPADDFNGTFTVRARVTDGELESEPADVRVVVTARNDAPRGGPVPRQTATENIPFELELGPLFADPDDDPLSFAATGLPAGLALDAATGRLAGTPPPGTEARDYAVHLTVSDGSADLRTDFTIALLAAGRADLAIEIAAAPNPAAVGTAATWTFTVRNRAASVDVGNVDLTVELGGDVPITLAAASTPACNLSAAAVPALLECRIGPITGGASTAITLAATGSRPGDATAAATVAIADRVPLDADATNDSARATLQITERTSNAAQSVSIPDVRGAAVGDLDGDGAADVALATGGGVVVLPAVADPANPAKRVLGAAVPIGAGAAANAVALADLDADGDLDAAIAYADGTADRVSLNGGSFAFTETALGGDGAASHAVAVGDLDGDGLPDVAIARDGEVVLHRNTGGGTFDGRDRLAAGAARAIAIVDLFADQRPEIVIANADSDAAVYTATANAWELAARLPSGPSPSVASADFDADGQADLAFARADGAGNRVFLNQSAAEPAFFPVAPLGAAATVALLAADIDLDGDADLIAINVSGSHQVYENGNDSSAVFLLEPEQLAASGAVGAAAGIVSVDDRLDVVVVGSAGADVFYNDGLGGLGRGDEDAPTLSLIGEPTVAVTVGDVYTDAGATASDAVDGDLTARVTVANPVDTAIVGTYTVTYAVVDSSGNAAEPVSRAVEVRARNEAGGGGGGAICIALGLLLLSAACWNRRRTT